MPWAIFLTVTKPSEIKGGDSHFVFRFSLQGHSGGFDPVNAVRFAWEDNNELLPTAVKVSSAGVHPSDSCGFITGNPANAILTTLKPVEENGLIARIWECAGSSEPVKIQIAGEFAPKVVIITDPLEHDRAPLPFKEGCVLVLVRPRGITTLRLAS